MGRAAARDQDRRQSFAPQDQHGRRSWRPVGTLDSPQGSGRSLWLHPDPEPGLRMIRTLLALLLSLAFAAVPAAAQRGRVGATVEVVRDGDQWTADYRFA